MNRKILLFLLLMLTVCHMSMAQNMNNSEKSASCASFSEMFNQIEAICDNDNGKLWGINLYAPFYVSIKTVMYGVISKIRNGNFKFAESVLLENILMIRILPIQLWMYLDKSG